jgi:hypothetical protein
MTDEDTGRRAEHVDSNKRIRVSQACEQCRQRRNKCDGRRPTCGVCASNSRVCSYDPSPKKRGIPPGSSQVAERKTLLLELLVALMWTGTSDVDKQLQQAIIEPSNGQTTEDESYSHFQAVLQSYRASTTARLIQSLVTDSSILSPLWNSITGHGHLQTQRALGSATAISLVDSNATSAAPAASIVHATSTVVGKSQIPHLGQLTSCTDTAKELALPSNVSDYISHYLSNTHIWLPILDRYRLLSFIKQKERAKALADLDAEERLLLALVWAVIAQASPQVSTLVVGRAASNIAQSLLPTDVGQVRPEHIQVLIVLSLFHFAAHEWRTSWILIATADRLGLDEAEPTSVPFAGPISSNHKRTLMACAVVEPLIATALDVPADMNVLRIGPEERPEQDTFWALEESGWEEWDTWGGSADFSQPCRAISTFNRMTALYRLRKLARNAENRGDDFDRCQALLQWRHESEADLCHLARYEDEGSPRNFLLLYIVYWTEYALLCLNDPVPEDIPGASGEKPASEIERLSRLYQTRHGPLPGPPTVTSALLVASRIVDPGSSLGTSLRELLGSFSNPQRTKGVTYKRDDALRNQQDRYTHLTVLDETFGAQVLEKTFGSLTEPRLPWSGKRLAKVGERYSQDRSLAIPSDKRFQMLPPNESLPKPLATVANFGMPLEPIAQPSGLGERMSQDYTRSDDNEDDVLDLYPADSDFWLRQNDELLDLGFASLDTAIWFAFSPKQVEVALIGIQG